MQIEEELPVKLKNAMKNKIKWCFSTLGCADRNLFDILSLADRYNISALEVRGIAGELQNERIDDFSPENAQQTKNAFEKANVRPLILGTSVSLHDEKYFNKNIYDGKQALDIAQRTGFSAIRVFGDRITDNEKECIQRVSSGVNELCLYAEKSGVSVFLEVHGDFNTVSRLLPVCEYCGNSKSFGIIWDIGHTHSNYGENWQEFYKAFSPFIRHVHLKDIKDGKLVLPGDGELQINGIVDQLITDGYDGYFSLEWEKHWHKELPGIEKALDKLLKIFS